MNDLHVNDPKPESDARCSKAAIGLQGERGEGFGSFILRLCQLKIDSESRIHLARMVWGKASIWKEQT